MQKFLHEKERAPLIFLDVSAVTCQSEEISPVWSRIAAVGARRLSTNIAVVKQWGSRRNLRERRKMVRVRQTPMMEPMPTV